VGLLYPQRFVHEILISCRALAEHLYTIINFISQTFVDKIMYRLKSAQEGPWLCTSYVVLVPWICRGIIRLLLGY
jgi:hypothetical protein